MPMLCSQCGKRVEPNAAGQCPGCLSALAASTDVTVFETNATASSSPKPVENSTTIGKFQIIKPIGQGGMGHVFSAKEPVTETVVAVKMLKEDLAKDPRLVESFLREARHMYQLSHPSILKVLEVSPSMDRPYFAMPMASCSLADKLKAAGGISEAEALRYAVEIAEGMAHAHNKGLIHRDLKPANILLDEDGRSMITDFGLVRPFHSDSLIDMKQVIPEGTPAYMSPSVAAGKVEDTRCDIYSYGALLYEVLTGTPPYSGTNPLDVLEMVKAGPPVPILSRKPDADKRLAFVAETCMERQLRNRYASMSDVLEDLRLIRNGKQPIGTGTKPVRRPFPVLPLVSVAVLIALAGAVTVWMLNGRENKVVPEPVGNRPIPQRPAMEQGRQLPPTLEIDDSLSVDELLGEADNARRSGRIRVATETYLAILQKDPGRSDVRQLLVESLIEIGHKSAAQNEIKMWLDQEPGHPAALKLSAEVEEMSDSGFGRRPGQPGPSSDDRPRLGAPPGEQGGGMYPPQQRER